ncbi:MAG TPA: hypothetical protein VNP20_18710 [Nocardioidaceae bacterium]|nr:hypothetical protein [Nocardioidaceae bacterium]
MAGTAGLVGGLALSPSTVAAGAVRTRAAARAGDVAGMVGVRTNLAAANNSLYGNIPLVASALNDLGIRHIRERMVLPDSSSTQARNQREGWQRLASMVPRLRVSGITGTVDDSQGTVAEFAAYIESALGGSSGVVGSVENANEPNAPDLPWNQDDPDGWVAPTRARQRAMAHVFRGRPGLQGLDVLGPSLSGGAGRRQYHQLGDLSSSLDVGNFHVYPGNDEPGTPSTGLDEAISALRANAGTKPYWCTETGMHQGMLSRAAMAYYPESVAAEYIARIPLEHFSRGVSRVYLFELLDDEFDPVFLDNQAHFGLLRYQVPTPTPKPAYDALRRLLALLHDPGPTFRPQGEPVTLRGAPADCRHLLLQKRDARRYLCLWRDVPLWDLSRNRAIPVEPVPVGVDIGRPGRVRSHVPADASGPVRTESGVSGMSVDLGGSVVILEID